MEATQITPAEKKLLDRLTYASRILSLEGHDDFNQGQVSSRMPGRKTFFIKRAVVGFNEAVPSDMIPASVDCTQPVHPDLPPELALHQGIYEARPDVAAIIHSHAPNGLVFGATDLEIKPISHDGAFFQGRTGRFTETSQTILNIETGRAVARALGDRPALFLQNHGTLVVGKSIREATILALLLERACRLQIMAETLGRPYQVSSAEDVEGKKDFIYDDTAIKTYWDYMVRKIDQQPFYHWKSPAERENEN